MNQQTNAMEVDEEAVDQTIGGTEGASEAVEEKITNDQQDPSEEKQQEGPGYEPAAFNNLSREAGARTPRSDTNLDVILDIGVTLSMEIGRSKISIQELLQMAKGSVLELDRLAGDPLDVLVNGTLVAKGEVVVVNDKFGVRLIDVISPAERVNKLK